MRRPLVHDSRFEIIRRLGEGAFGVVEEAFDHERGMRVALKSLKRVRGAARARFRAEFRQLADLTHPSLPLFFELFAESDDWFFTMELVDGERLDTWVRGESRAPDEVSSIVTQGTSASARLDAAPRPRDREPNASDGAWSEARLRSALEQLRDVVAFLHSRGYVHRDLKPSNVCVRNDGHLMLLDFGLAARVGVTEPHFVGTAAYAAPEQARGAPAAPSADAYALGTILFELIAGRRPFLGSGAQLLLDKQMLSAPSLLGEQSTNSSIRGRLRRTATTGGFASRVIRGRLRRTATTGGFASRVILINKPYTNRVPADLADLAARWLDRDPSRRPPVRDHAEASDEPFVGRTEELAMLGRLWDAVLAGDTRVVVIDGPSGIGKTTLVEHATRDALARAPLARLFLGRPNPKERVPFNAWTDAPGAHDGPKSMRAALEEHTAIAPAIVWLDDLQWADDDSLALLLALLRPPQLRPALFVLSHRPLSQDLVLPCARELIELGPLGPSETSRLAGELGATEHAAELAARSGGHPLFVRELCRHEPGRGEARGDLDHVLGERIAALPEIERRLLHLLAVSNAPLDEACLAEASSTPRGEVATALERLRRAQLVRYDASGMAGYHTYHDRIREVTLAGLGGGERRAAHLALLAALDGDEDATLSARLEHLLGADRRKEAAGAALRAAERAAAIGAFTRAATLVDEGLRTKCIPREDEPRVRERRVVWLERAHRAHDAAEEALIVAKLTEDAHDAEAFRMRAARHFLATGDLTRGREVLGGVLRRAGVTMPGDAGTLAELVTSRLRLRRALRRPAALPESATRARHYPLLRAVADGLAMTDHVRGHVFQRRALLAALASGDAELRAEALAMEALFVGSTNANGRRIAERYIRAACDLFPDRALPPRAKAWEDVARATFAKHERPSYDTAAKLEAAERQVEAIGGDPWVLASIRLVRGHCLRLLGDLPALRAHAGKLVEEAESRSDFFVSTTGHLGGLIVWLADDAPLAARQIVSQVKWPHERGTFLLQHWLAAEAEVEISLYEGAEQARTLLSRLGDMHAFLRLSLVKRLQSVRVCCNYTLGRALVAAIEGGAASWRDRLELRAVLAWLRRERLGYASARAALLEAGIAELSSDRARALAALARAEREGERAELLLEPLAATYLRARLTGASTADAERRFVALGVQRPERFIHVLVPGFRASRPSA